MLGVILTVGGALLVGTVVVVGIGFGLAVAFREYGRRHPDPAWKPTGYRTR
jgi:hypothetical protein